MAVRRKPGVMSEEERVSVTVHVWDGIDLHHRREHDILLPPGVTWGKNFLNAACVGVSGELKDHGFFRPDRTERAGGSRTITEREKRVFIHHGLRVMPLSVASSEKFPEGVGVFLNYYKNKKHRVDAV